MGLAAGCAAVAGADGAALAQAESARAVIAANTKLMGRRISPVDVVTAISSSRRQADTYSGR